MKKFSLTTVGLAFNSKDFISWFQHADHFHIKWFTGEEWEKAWLTHVDQWQSPCNDPADDCFNSSKQVKDMNKDKFNKSFHQWTSTHISICHYDKVMIETNGEIFIITEEMPRNFHELVVDSRRKLFREGIDFDHEGFNLPTYRLRDANYVGVPCKILESYDETQTFDVVYFGAFEKDDSTSSKTVTILSNIPANYVRFQVRPFESDMMVPRSFRHEIGFPDEQFPLLWKDISK